MKFCPKCKSIMMLKDGKWVCMKCGFKIESNKDESSIVFVEKENKKDLITVISSKGQELPIVKDVACPKCGYNEAYFWTVQTRAGDEAETKFYRCVKCKYTWRVYD